MNTNRVLPTKTERRAKKNKLKMRVSGKGTKRLAQYIAQRARSK